MPASFVQAGPFAGQKPGTSGLRKKTAAFMAPHYLPCFVQAVFDALGGAAGKTIVLGGDGRFFSPEAAGIILRMAAGQGAARVVVGQGALLSTPAVSNLIRARGADFGVILSASHNPGGPQGDFGVKINIANGGPAPDAVTAAIHAATQALRGYAILDADAPPLAAPGTVLLGPTAVEVVNPVAAYADLMERLFDFDAIAALIAGGFRIRYDAMCAVTGPYAVEILERRLGALPGTVVNATPLPDFGGMHPDPNPASARDLWDAMMEPGGPDFGAASDGDGDRNMILGRGIYVAPSDSLALLAAHARICPGYAAGLAGIARSMPTSTAADRVAAALGVPLYETPTGWKYFGSLLDAGRASLCGEESFGTGSDHLREKDGLWAVLMWLNILAVRGDSVAGLLAAHWRRFGRNWYSRHDYAALPVAQAEAVMAGLRAALPSLPGRRLEGMTVAAADDFAYRDPVDGSEATGQGLRIRFECGARIVLRLSGTGTEGATLRLYLERLEDDPARTEGDVQTALAPVIAAAERLAGIARLTGRNRPDAIT
jgi:phosphoglucomutase